MSSLWDRIADVEEMDRDDEAINRALRWREVERHLEGVSTILDVGAGTGAFSIPLAKRGYRVTHFDISAEMIARAQAADASLDFVRGSAVDLGGRQADLVLCFDGAISFAGTDAPKVLAEVCRATKKTLILTVSNRAAMVATWLKDSLQATGGIHSAVREMLNRGVWDAGLPENAALHPEPIWSPAFKAFGHAELRAALEDCRMNVIALRAIGSLTHLMLPHGIALPRDEEFIELCERFDIDVAPGGPGSFRRAGLLAVATPQR